MILARIARRLRLLHPPSLALTGSQPHAASLLRFRDAEARLHRSAAALERASLDAVDRAAPPAEPSSLSREERIGRAVAEVTRRHREARHAP